MQSISIYLQNPHNDPEFVTAIIGLIGVLVGSVISYYFNRRLNIENSKATYAVQRKNLIFSKIYKELVEIKSSLTSLPEKSFYFQIYSENIKNNSNYYNSGGSGDTFGFSEKRYPLASFNLWNEIKKDIRNSQIPNELRTHLDKLESLFNNYFEALEHTKKDIETVRATRAKESGISFSLDSHLFYYDLLPSDILERNIKKHHSVGPLGDNIKMEMENVINLICKTESLLSTKQFFEALKSEFDSTYIYLDNLIKHIVDKYEFGQNL